MTDDEWVPNALERVDATSLGRRLLYSLESDTARIGLLLSRADLTLLRAALRHHRGRRAALMLKDLDQLDVAVYGRGGPA